MALPKFYPYDQAPQSEGSTGGQSPGGSPLVPAYHAWQAMRAANAAKTDTSVSGVGEVPAATQIAVRTAADMGGSPTSYASPYSQGDLRKLEAPLDPNVNRAPNAAEAEQNYGAYKSREAARAAQASQPLKYPGGAEEISGRLAGMDSRGVDFGGLPRMQYQQAPMGGGGGMFSPAFHSAMQNYQDMSVKADDGSIAGAWRSRGFAKQRDRMFANAMLDVNAQSGAISAGASAMGANASMMRAQNEPALEGMRNWVATRGQDQNYDLGRMQDQTRRYGIDTTNESANRRTDIEATTSRRQQEFSLAPYLGQMKWDEKAHAAAEGGDFDAAQRYSTIGRHPPKSRISTEVTGLGDLWTTDEAGNSTLTTRESALAAAKAATTKAAERAAGRQIKEEEKK